MDVIIAWAILGKFNKLNHNDYESDLISNRFFRHRS